VCVFLCTAFRLIVVLFCVLCLIVVPLPPGEHPFAVKINIYLKDILPLTCVRISDILP
jgi:hypothetical protein